MVSKTPTPAQARAQLHKRSKWTRDDFELGLLGLPAFVWFVLFSYLPMFGLIIAFKKYQIFPRQSFLSNLLQSKWVWFDNFKFFLGNNTFGMLLRNTLLYNLVFIVLGIVIPVSLATFFNVSLTDDLDFNQWDEVRELNEQAKPSVLLGFFFDTTNVQDELASCIEIYNRYKGEVMTGTTDPTVSVPQMMAEMRAAGFDAIVAEAQAQVDAFKAAK